MSAKHTRTIRPIDPGPWEWNELSPDDPEWELCEVWQADGTEEGKLICSGGLGIANARLIAAAPELLEALQAVLLREEAGMENDADMITQIKAALAKATGATP